VPLLENHLPGSCGSPIGGASVQEDNDVPPRLWPHKGPDCLAVPGGGESIGVSIHPGPTVLGPHLDPIFCVTGEPLAPDPASYNSARRKDKKVYLHTQVGPLPGVQAPIKVEVAWICRPYPGHFFFETGLARAWPDHPTSGAVLVVLHH